jgi:GNAT superfamily N-acetyltransferase
MRSATNGREKVTIRTHLRPGDLGYIVYLHGILYAREYGFDHTFEAYVAGPLAEFACHATDHERIWIAQQDGRIVGCIAIVAAANEAPAAEATTACDVAQLRWFLVDPSVRGAGLGKRLL